jgi:hypothetical protein
MGNYKKLYAAIIVLEASFMITRGRLQMVIDE